VDAPDNQWKRTPRTLKERPHRAPESIASPVICPIFSWFPLNIRDASRRRAENDFFDSPPRFSMAMVAEV